MNRAILRFFLAVCVACLVVAPILVGVLASSGCGTAQHPSAAAAEFRVVTHAIAEGYCAVHTFGTPLILLAEGRYPELRMIVPAADAFCRNVQSRTNGRTAGITYTLRVDGFEESSAQ